MRTKSDKPIRAVLDAIQKMPREAFGTGKGRQGRKLVYVTIASYANPDGSSSWPALTTIAECALLEEKQVRRGVTWLREHGLLTTQRVGRKNNYNVLFPGKRTLSCPDTTTENCIPDSGHLEAHSGHLEKNTGHMDVQLPPLDRPLTAHNAKNQTMGEISLSTMEEQLLMKVWNYHLETNEKTPVFYTFTAKRKSMGVERLRESLAMVRGDPDKACQLMKCALDGLASSEWHLGKNQYNRRFTNWEHAFGDREKYEKMLQLANGD
jgi:hypothetical protein